MNARCMQLPLNSFGRYGFLETGVHLGGYLRQWSYDLGRLSSSMLVYPCLLAVLYFSILSTWPNHGRSPSSILSSTPFVTPHNSHIRALETHSILLIPSNPLKLSTCTAVTLDLSFSFHNIVSLAYVRTGKSNVLCNTLAQSICRSLALTNDLIAPATLLPLATLPHLYLIRPKHTPNI